MYWEHDIEVWIKQRFLDDHRTWQQFALNAEQWTNLRNQYADDWPNNQFTNTYHNKAGERHTTSTHKNKVDGTGKQKEAPHTRIIPTPGRPRRITIVLKRSNHKEAKY